MPRYRVIIEMDAPNKEVAGGAVYRGMGAALTVSQVAVARIQAVRGKSGQRKKYVIHKNNVIWSGALRTKTQCVELIRHIKKNNPSQRKENWTLVEK